MLEQIYRRHRQGLYTLALSITRDAESAEDAVHDAFARLCRARSLPEGDCVAYAFAAVRNAAIDQIRRRQGPPSVPLSIFDGDMTSDDRRPDGPLLTAERDRLLRAAVEALPESQRQAVVLKLYGGLTFDQIAAASGEPLSTVASRYRRALESLKRSVESLV